MNMKRAALFIPYLLLMLSSPALADPIVIDFESLRDREVVTTQFGSVVFSNTLALKSGFLGGSLNEFENPPHSGVTVITDDAGPMSIRFVTPITAFSGFFTYRVPLIVSAFGEIGNLLGSTNSLFSNNQALSGVLGASPNELITLRFGAGISRVVITGGPSGNSFTLDDLTTTNGIAVIPEPGTLSLLFAGGLAFLLFRPRSNH